MSEVGGYAEILNSCKSTSLEEIRKHAHVLPHRYVGAAPPRKTTANPSKTKRARLTTQWRQQQAQARRLDTAIEENLARLGSERGWTGKA